LLTCDLLTGLGDWKVVGLELLFPARTRRHDGQYVADMQSAELHLRYSRELHHIPSRTRAHRQRGDPRGNNHVLGENWDFLSNSAGGQVLARSISIRELEVCQDVRRGYPLGIRMVEAYETCLVLDAVLVMI